MTKEKIAIFKKALAIDDNILGISFSENLPPRFKFHRDTACTILARAFFIGETLVFDAKRHPQLCPGGGYFLKLSGIKYQQAVNVYVKKERVFRNKVVCQEFLSVLPEFPASLKNKLIIVKTFEIKDKPSVVMILANPAQVGRIINLLNYDGYKDFKVFPNQPTCLSFFAPLVTKQPHLNFIDYYDRYYQGRLKRINIWPETKMIVSLRFNDFRKVLTALEKSPSGVFKPDLSPMKIDDIKDNGARKKIKIHYN